MITMRNCYIAILALLFLAVSLAAQPHPCSQRTVVGTYALAYDGTVMITLPDMTQVPVPTAGLSIVTINPEGEVSAPGYMAFGDAVQWYPQMPGTITVNSDCTGSIDWGYDMVGELIIQDGGDEISSIMIQGGPLGLPTVTGRWKRISRVLDIHQPCSAVGTYVARQSGVNMIPGVGPVPGAFLSRVSIDYDGTIEMNGTAMIAGTQMTFTLADGMWEEGELACTGKVTGTIIGDMGGMPMGGPVENWLVVLDGGKELWGIAVSEPIGSPVALLTAKRISRQPADLE